MSDKSYPVGGSHKPTRFPYLRLDQGSALAEGGIVIDGTSAVSMKIGDSVYFNSSGQWAKSATPANYAALNGIVIGGGDGQTFPYNEVLQDDAVVGQLSIAAGLNLIILTYGVAKTLADAALATIGTKLTGASSTAGRVGSTSAAAGNYLGIQLETAAGAGSIIRVFVGAAH